MRSVGKVGQEKTVVNIDKAKCELEEGMREGKLCGSGKRTLMNVKCNNIIMLLKLKHEQQFII